MYCRNCGIQLNSEQTVCFNCGTEVGKGKKFCHKCGLQTEEGADACATCGASLNKSESNYNADENNYIKLNTVGITGRSIPVSIILSLFTCGLYSIYWFVCLTNEVNRMSGRTQDTNGLISLLLSLVTCGLYTYYWAYKIGEKQDSFLKDRKHSAILYLALTVFGLGLVVYILTQDAINETLERERA